MKGKSRKVLAGVMAALMVLGLLPVSLFGGSVVAKAATNTYVLSADDVSTGTLTADQKCGTNDYFTIKAISSKNVVIDTGAKTFTIDQKDKEITNRIKLSGVGESTFRSIAFTVTENNTATITLCAVSSNGSYPTEIALYKTSDGSVVANTTTAIQNSTTPTLTFENIAAGSYYLATTSTAAKPANVFYIAVTETEESGSGANITAPTVSTVNVELKDAEVTISGTGTAGDEGSKYVIVRTDGNKTEKTFSVDGDSASYTYTDTLTASGTYSYKVYGNGTADTAAVEADKTITYTLPLATPSIKTISAGEGKVTLEWEKVAEAEKYIVYVDGDAKDVEASKTTYTAESLENGKKYTFKLAVVRGEETKESDEKTATPMKAIDTSTAIPGLSVLNQNGDNAVIIIRDKGDITVSQAAATGGVTSKGIKSTSFIYWNKALTTDFSIKADVTINSVTASSTSLGLFVGAFQSLEENTDGNLKNQQYVAGYISGQNQIRYSRSKVGGGQGNSTSSTAASLGTKYTIETTRSGNSIKTVISDASGNEIYSSTADYKENASSDYICPALQEGAALYPAIAIAGVTADISNIKITSGSETLFDSSTLTGEFTPFADNWKYVDAAVISNTAVNNTKGEIVVTVDGEIGVTGAGNIEVQMKDASGTVVDTQSSSAFGQSTHELTFTPEASGDYTFVAVSSRPNETTTKTSAEVTATGFVLPLAQPTITSVTSAGSGNVSVVWEAVPEAESYEVYADGKLAGTTKALKYTVSGLTVDTKYAFTVVAVRGTDKSEASKAAEATVTAEAQVVWGFSAYGSSTNKANNGYEGSANDGSVTVYSEGGKGKVVPNSTDGLAFYYTAVPTEYNFTLKANVHVENWTFSNGQEGFGLLATDRLGPNGDSSAIWNNSYMVGPNKVEYYWDSSTDTVSTSGRKYTMKLGVGVIEKLGVTAANLDRFQNNDTVAVQQEFTTQTLTLETSAADKDLDAGTYNVVANATTAVEGSNEVTEDFILEIQKNNTGYFATYYDAAGNIIGQQKFYEPDALNNIDADNVYVGFFASRNARATFSNIEFSTILASEDAPAEERPITEITPTLNVVSAKIANTEDYTFSLVSNVAGTADITLNSEVVAENVKLEADVRYDLPSKLLPGQRNEYKVVFRPDPDQELAKYTVLANTDEIQIVYGVNRSTIFDGRVNIYVAPNGSAYGSGSESNPVDIYTAVQYVQPGQTIILKEGTYELESTVQIQRGINGTADNLIRMIADPEASSRPVFDFQGLCAGMVFGGNYWYFNGFDVTNSGDGLKGIQVSGSYNTVDNVNMYHNGNTGLQISRLYSSDLFDDWPSYNLILNCTSYGNADSGYEDADGFAAKLTVGNGNVFDGCLSYNNADDGWDLFAKVETGSIGSVTIQNCIAYGNGYLEDGTNAGNGNGFKMGGDSLSGYHKLINSYSFFNKAKGIDSNSCPDIQVENSISYNNESYNVAFYTNNAANTDFAATGIISFKDSTIKSGLTTAEQQKPVGSQDKSKYLGDTNYYWDGTKSVNASGVEITADMFKTLEFTGVTRNADGTLNLNGFLELTDKAPANAGAVPGGTSSGTVVIATETAVDSDDENSGSPISTVPSTSTETTVEETTNRDNYIPTSVFTELINSGKTLVVNVTDDLGNVIASYTVDGTQFTAAPNSDFKLEITVGANDKAIFDIIKAAMNIAESKAEIIKFAHSGNLNGNLKVKVKLTSGKFAPGTALKLYYFNEKTRELEDQNQTVVVAADNTVEFTISHCSAYVLLPADATPVTTETPAATQPDTTAAAPDATTPETADRTPLGLLLSVLVLSAGAFIVVKKRRITE